MADSRTASGGPGPGLSPEQADTDLVARANRGEADALEAIYLRHRDWVTSLAYRFARDRDDALDVLQDTFAYVFGKFPGFELRAKMTTFLYPVVRNLALERIRKRGRTVPLDDDAPEPVSPEVRDRAAERRELARTVQRLPEGEREVVILRFADEMSLAEIARALEIPLGTVKSRLNSALSRLRTSLGSGRAV